MKKSWFLSLQLKLDIFIDFFIENFLFAGFELSIDSEMTLFLDGVEFGVVRVEDGTAGAAIAHNDNSYDDSRYE